MSRTNQLYFINFEQKFAKKCLLHRKVFTNFRVAQKELARLCWQGGYHSELDYTEFYLGDRYLVSVTNNREMFGFISGERFTNSIETY